MDPVPLAAHVTLGRSATSTLGNAEETATWVRTHDIHSLIVVTADYHMPRALLEMEREMPGVTLYPRTRAAGGYAWADHVAAAGE